MTSSQAVRSTPLAPAPESLWTLSGACFGYRRGDSLFTYDGVEVGRFVAGEVYGPGGNYLGEMRPTEDGDRLITSKYKKSRIAATFTPTTDPLRSRAPKRMAEPLYCGYEEFPAPEILKAVVLELTQGLKSLSNANRPH